VLKDQSPGVYWLMGILGVIGLFFSIILHELCHSLVGRRYGLPIGGIKLFIFGGIAEMLDEPPTPKAEFLTAVAGPACSFVLGIGLNLLFYAGLFSESSPQINSVIKYLGTVNLALGIFNMLPGYPLDGGRVLRAFLWWWKND